MTATGHALIAALIVAKFPNPYISLPLAFASHFACDVLPHWDSGTHHEKKTRNRFIVEAAVDVSLSIITSFLLYHYILGGTNYLLLFTGVFISQLPDWIMAPYAILRLRGKLMNFSRFMYHVQHRLNTKLDKPWGIVTQIVAVFILYILLFIIF